MYLFRVRNDIQRIFVIVKRIQLVETVHLSTYIDNFEEKYFKKFFEGVKKIKIFFSFYNVKFPEEFIFEIVVDENRFLMVF